MELSWAVDDQGKRRYVDSDFRFNPGKVPKPLIPIIPGLISEGDLATWFGAEKSWKSSVLLQMFICLAVGRPFLTFPSVPPMRVAIHDFETPEVRFYDRYWAVVNCLQLTAKERDLLAKNLVINMFLQAERDFGATAEKLFLRKNEKGRIIVEKESLDWWRGCIDKANAKLHAIDPFRCLTDADENNSIIGTIMMTLRGEIFRTSAGIITHHTAKRSQNSNMPSLASDMRAWSNLGRGSGAIKAHADVIICQEYVKRADENACTWGAFGRNIPDITPVVLTEVMGENGTKTYTFEVVPDNMDIHASNFRDEVIEATGQSTWASKAEIVRALLAKGFKKRTVYRRLAELQQSGALIEDDAGWRLAAIAPPETLDAGDVFASKNW